MLEFEVNKYITLKLENNKTFIYVNGKKFIQCIRLILRIPSEEMSSYDHAESIDEVIDVFENFPQHDEIIHENRGDIGHTNMLHTITPEEEFQGHCSNIQVWAENDYDTRLLHSNISFPLLKELFNAGDPTAMMVFKEEIATRFKSKCLTVIEYLFRENYLDYLNTEEKELTLEHLENHLETLDFTSEKNVIRNILAHLSNTYLGLKSYNKVIATCTKILDLFSNDSLGWNNLSVAYNEVGKFHDALDAIKRAKERKPRDKIILNNLAWTYLNLKEFDKTVEICEMLIKNDPSHSTAYNHLGFAYYNLGKREEGIKMIMKALQLNKKYSRAYYYLARIYLDQGNFKEALNMCEKSINYASKPANMVHHNIIVSFNTKLGEILREQILKMKENLIMN